MGACKVVLALSLVFLTGMPVRQVRAQSPAAEVRGVWLTNVDSEVLLSRDRIAAAMQFLARHHFNVVYPVVWNDGVTLYPSALMDSLFGLAIDPVYQGRDPLAEVIEEAHLCGLAVIPWFEFGFASAYKKEGGHLLQRKPQWRALDRDGRLLQKNGFEWMNAYHPEVQSFLARLVLEIVNHYDVDGIQGDDRLPAQPVEGGYDAYSDSLFRARHAGLAPPRDFLDPAWMRWRGDILNTFACNLYHSVKSRKSDILVSWAPNIYPWCYENYLQDWPAWISGGYADELIPQVYRYNLKTYQTTLRQTKSVLEKLPQKDFNVYPGILIKLGDYLIEPEYLLKAIALNRKLGFQGEVLFFFEGLRANHDKLAKTLLSGPYRHPAPLPKRGQ